MINNNILITAERKYTHIHAYLFILVTNYIISLAIDRLKINIQNTFKA